MQWDSFFDIPIQMAPISPFNSVSIVGKLGSKEKSGFTSNNEKSRSSENAPGLL